MLTEHDNWGHLTYSFGAGGDTVELKAKEIEAVRFKTEEYACRPIHQTVTISDHGHNYPTPQAKLGVVHPTLGLVALHCDVMPKVTMVKFRGEWRVA